MLLFALKRNLQTSGNGRLRDILRKFEVLRARQEVVKKLQLKLLGTTAGQLSQSFLRWKALPDKSGFDELKASVFEKSLNKFKI